METELNPYVPIYGTYSVFLILQRHSSRGVLRNFAKFAGIHLCQSVFFKACNFIKKETLVQTFSCEFCEISKDIFFYRTPSVAASVLTKIFIWPLACNIVEKKEEKDVGNKDVGLLILVWAIVATIGLVLVCVSWITLHCYHKRKKKG